MDFIKGNEQVRIDPSGINISGNGNNIILDGVSGRVGIGTSTFSTPSITQVNGATVALNTHDKLHVNGGIRVSENSGSSNAYLQLTGPLNQGGAIDSWNTSMFLNASSRQNIRLCENGGNVGIGTSDPKSLLNIKCTHSVGDNGQDGQWNTVSGLTIARSWDDCRWEFVNGYDNSLMIRNIHDDGGIYKDNVLVLDDNGNVGIGTNAPGKFHDDGDDGSFDGRILAIHGGAPGQNNGIARLVLACDDNHTASIYAQHTGNGNTHLGFLTTTTTNIPVERMRITENGNVGIGIATPRGTLEISRHGNIKTTNWIPDVCPGIILANTTNFSDAGQTTEEEVRSFISFQHDARPDAPSINLQVELAAINIVSPARYHDHGNGANTDMVFKLAAGYGGDMSYEERVRFTAGGVGIGTTAPSAKLDVNGDVKSSAGTLTSDDRIKHNEVDISGALATINNITTKHYLKTLEMYEADTQLAFDTSGNVLDPSGNIMVKDKDFFYETGIIAQELRNIPELAFCVKGKEYRDDIVTIYEKDLSDNFVLDSSGNQIATGTETIRVKTTLGVDYNSIFTTHIQATQELSRKNDRLEAELAEMNELSKRNGEKTNIIMALEELNAGKDEIINDLKTRILRIEQHINLSQINPSTSLFKKV